MTGTGMSKSCFGYFSIQNRFANVLKLNFSEGTISCL